MPSKRIFSIYNDYCNNCLQYAAYVSDRSSTHGGQWLSSLSSYPVIQGTFFLVFLAVQILLFAIFVESVFFTRKVEINTSLEYVKIEDFSFPQITFCSSSVYDKRALNGNFLLWLFHLSNRLGFDTLKSI